MGAPCVDAVDCNQFRALQRSLCEFLLSAALFPRPGYVLLRYADSPNCLIVSDGRRSVPRNGAFLCTTVPSSAPEGILETKGCGHESEKPCSRLLSADTFGAAPWAEAPRSSCRDYALPSRSGNSQ